VSASGGRSVRSAATLRTALICRDAEEDEMRSIFRPITWMLATVVVSVMAHAAGAGSFTRGCAARDLQLLIVIEEQELTGSIPAEKINEALLEMMHARIVCHQGRVLDALAIYDAVTESIQPIRSGRALATGIK
jgi:hypothetical protein